MDFSKEFSRIGKGDAASAGGKGASLGEMTSAGIPVPPGFVILSNAFERFLEETDLNTEIDTILHSVDQREMGTVENASERIQALILNAKMPEDIAATVQEFYEKLDAQFVAVRSSATAEDSASAAWAGQLDSFLNTTEETLLVNVQKCWASLFTPRAIFYRYEKELHKTKISVAVVVQKMVQSEVSGIAFSVHPVTEDYNQLIIEAGFGLGEAIVSGSVTPDSYVVEKNPRRIIDKNITYQSRALWRAENGGNEWRELSEEEGTKPALSDEQALELAEIILRIESHYSFPCDIEWAYEAGHFYITQSRPITTLAPKTDANKDVTDAEEIIFTKIFSREKPLFYFAVWDDSDRLGWKDFFGYTVQHNLFTVPPAGNKGSVWYSAQEIAEVDVCIDKKLTEDPRFLSSVFERFKTFWPKILPYIEEDKKFESLKEFLEYYENLVTWWSAMTTVFTVPDKQHVSEESKSKILDWRKKSEKYTEKMSRIMREYFVESFPDLAPYAFFVHPRELEALSTGDVETIQNIRQRAEGCFMLDGAIHPTSLLDETLRARKMALEKVAGTETNLIRGTVASKGGATGVVVVVRGFADLPRVQAGNILVTEMTNPDYVPYMKIAGAIVTNEGGITCHAAIASRELHKPCVIGTKFATQILHDGDLVEVDADNGVVRIIERANDGEVKKDVIELIKDTDWHSDWSGPFSLFGLSLPTNTYFEGMEKYFGKGLSHVFVAFKDGIAFSRLPDDEYHALGVHLTEKAQDKEFVKKWASQFKMLANKVIQETAVSAEEYVKKLPELLPHYQAYGAHNVATKIAFDVGFDKLSKESKDLLEEARKYSETFYKDDADKIEQALHFLAKKTGYAYEEVYMLTYDELNAYLKSRTLPPQSVLKERWIASGIHFTKDKTTILSSKELAEVEEHRRGSADRTELAGQVAYSGKVQGKCRIILDYKNASLEKGEVLVTGMTDPNFVELMKKAAGIITDGGGMLSHAAIVARELKKPCVIGTKFATQVLHDGDLVEVDADNGVVRILERV